MEKCLLIVRNAPPAYPTSCTVLREIGSSNAADLPDKVSLMTNVNSAPAGHFVIHAKTFHDNPYDGHTLNEVISGVTKATGINPEKIYVDKGYAGHDYPQKLKVFKSGQKRGVTSAIKKELKRRSVIEPVIGHMKNEGRLGRNYLKGILGDKLNVLLVAAGYNFKIILKWLRKILWLIFYVVVIKEFNVPNQCYLGKQAF